jgi:hypothetical protein
MDNKKRPHSRRKGAGAQVTTAIKYHLCVLAPPEKPSQRDYIQGLCGKT